MGADAGQTGSNDNNDDNFDGAKTGASTPGYRREGGEYWRRRRSRGMGVGDACQRGAILALQTTLHWVAKA